MPKRSNKIITTESQMVNVIIEDLLWRKVIVWRNNNTPVYDATKQIFRRMPKFAMKGVPDISGILPGGRALFIEVKKPKGYASPHQKEFLTNASRAGALAFIARSPQDVHKAIVEAGYRDLGHYAAPCSSICS